MAPQKKQSQGTIVLKLLSLQRKFSTSKMQGRETAVLYSPSKSSKKYFMARTVKNQGVGNREGDLEGWALSKLEGKFPRVQVLAGESLHTGDSAIACVRVYCRRVHIWVLDAYPTNKLHERLKDVWIIAQVCWTKIKQTKIGKGSAHAKTSLKCCTSRIESLGFRFWEGILRGFITRGYNKGVMTGDMLSASRPKWTSV